MATFDLESSLNSLPDSTILPNYERHPVVKAKIVDFSVFKTYDAHSDSPQPIPMHQMTLEALHSAMLSKVTSEAQPLLGGEHKNVYDDLRLWWKLKLILHLKLCLNYFNCALGVFWRQLHAPVSKKGALFTNPFTQKPILLLGNRSLFITDKARVNSVVSLLPT